MRKKKETIVVLSAHSDDYVLGAGGMIAKYTQQGKNVLAVVFSYGEKSHPWLKPKVVQNMRWQEARAASKLLGSQVIFFDLHEFHFSEEYPRRAKELNALLEKHAPTKIFTHSSEDPHPDHKAVHAISREIMPRLSFKPELYVYSIWNPVSLRTAFPALYVDTTTTFSLKLQALRAFRSQQIHIAYPFFLLLFRTVIDGLHLKKWSAEKFFRIA